MKQEIFELIVKARESIFELQNYLFENHREYYLAAKGVLENAIEHVANIEATIDEAEEEMLVAAKKDLSLICYTTVKAKDAYNAPVVQNVSETQTIEEAPTFEEPAMVEEVASVEPTFEEVVVEEAPVVEETVEEPTFEEVALIPDVTEEVVSAPVMEESVENTEEVALTETTGEENIEFNEEELNNLLAALDSANFEAIFDEEITPVTLEETEEVTPVETEEVTPVETEATEEVIYEVEAPVVEEITEVEEPTFEEVVVEEETPVEKTIEEPIFENSEEIDIQALDAFLNDNVTDDDDAFKI